MTDYRPPCQTAPDADAWFIDIHGKKSLDEEVKDFPGVDAEIRAWESLMNQPISEDIRERIEAQARRRRLIERRQAKQECYQCYFRLQCLDLALADPNLRSGTWGGYHENEIAEIRRLIKRRVRRQEARHSDATP